MLLVVVLLSLCAGIQATQSESDPFAQWLHSATVNLPFNKSISFAGSTIDIYDLSCTAIEMNPWEMNTTPQESLPFTVEGIGARCAADLTYSPILGSVVHGTLSITVRDSSISGDLQLGPNASIALTGCKTSVFVDINIQGPGVGPVIIDLLVTVLKKQIDATVDKLLCEIPTNLLQHLSNHTASLSTPPVAPDPAPAPPLPAGMVHWADVQLVHALSQHNHLMGQLLRNWLTSHGRTSVAFNVSTLLPEVTAQVAGVNVSVDLGFLNASGLESFEEITLLSASAYEPHSLLSRVDTDSFQLDLNTTGMQIVSLNTSLLIAPPLQLPGLDAAFLVKNNTIQMSYLVAASKEAMAHINIDSLKNRGFAPLAQQLVELDITQAALLTQIQSVSLTLESPASQPLLASMVLMLNQVLNQASATEGFSNVLVNLFNIGTQQSVLPAVNTVVHRLLKDAQNSPTPAPPATENHEYSDHWIKLIVILFIIALLVALYMLLRSKKTKAKYTALGAHQSGIVQFLSVFLCIGTMGVAIWAIMVPVCDVRIKVWTQLTEQDDSYVLTDRSLLVYSFPEMVRDFWGAGAYMITICLVVGTGMLPSLRGLTTGIVWCVPMSVSVRGWILLVMDMFGRLLFINQVFISLVVATLHITVTVPGMKAEIVAEPELGVLGGTVCTLLAILQWSWVIYLQSQTVHNQRKEARMSMASDPTSENSFDPDIIESLLDHDAEMDEDEDDEDDEGRQDDVEEVADVEPARQSEWSDTLPSFVYSTKLRTAAPSTSAAAVVLLVAAWGTFIGAVAFEILKFEIGGIGGAVDALFGEDKFNEGEAQVDFYMIQLGFDLPTMTDMSTGAATISILYLMLVFVGPICFLLLSTYQWIGTITGKAHNRSVRLARWLSPFLYSWCGLDVLFLGTFAAALEMNLPTQWIVKNQAGALCDRIHDVFNKECIHIDGTVPLGGWMLISAAVFAFLLFCLTTRTFGHPALCNTRSGMHKIPAKKGAKKHNYS